MATITSGDVLVNALTNGAITSIDQLVSKRTGGSNGNPQRRWKHWEPRVAGAAMTATVSGQWNSLLVSDSMPTSGGAVPTTWANPDNTLSGGIMQANASGGRNLYIAGLLGMLSSTPGTLLIYDRLGHMAGLSGQVVGDQNVNGGSAGTITRYTNGVGNFLAAEIFSAVGNTPEVLTITYTNDSGSSSTGGTVPFGGTGMQEAGRLLFYDLATGEQGVRDVTKVNLNGGTGVAGNWGVVIGHPLYYVTNAIGGYTTVTSFVDGPIPQVLASACLAVAFLPTIAGSPICELEIEMVEA